MKSLMRISFGGDESRRRPSFDPKKDQSYVLHVLGQEELAHVQFPVGQYTKAEVRELARQFELPVAESPESMDLCFLGDGDHRRFLQEHSIPT